MLSTSPGSTVRCVLVELIMYSGFRDTLSTGTPAALACLWTAGCCTLLAPWGLADFGLLSEPLAGDPVTAICDRAVEATPQAAALLCKQGDVPGLRASCKLTPDPAGLGGLGAESEEGEGAAEELIGAPPDSALLEAGAALGDACGAVSGGVWRAGQARVEASPHVTLSTGP